MQCQADSKGEQGEKATQCFSPFLPFPAWLVPFGKRAGVNGGAVGAGAGCRAGRHSRMSLTPPLPRKKESEKSSGVMPSKYGASFFASDRLISPAIAPGAWRGGQRSRGRRTRGPRPRVARCLAPVEASREEEREREQRERGKRVDRSEGGRRDEGRVSATAVHKRRTLQRRG